MNDSLSNISIATNLYSFLTSANSQNSHYNPNHLLKKKRNNYLISECLLKKYYKNEVNNDFREASYRCNGHRHGTKVIIQISDQNKTETESDSSEELNEEEENSQRNDSQLNLLNIMNNNFTIKSKIKNSNEKEDIKVISSKKKQINFWDNFNDKDENEELESDDKKIKMEDLINSIMNGKINELYSEIDINPANPFNIDFDIKKYTNDKDTSEDESSLEFRYNKNM